MREEISSLVFDYLKRGFFKSPVYDIGSSDEEYRKNQGYDFKDKFKKEKIKLCNVDIKNSQGVDIVTDAQNMSMIASRTVGGIILTEVLEHVWDFNKVMDECWRILKPDGLIIVTVPSYYKVHVAMPEPYKFDNGDYWRFTFQGVHLLCRNFKKINFGEFGKPEKNNMEYFYVGVKRDNFISKISEVIIDEEEE